MDAVQSKNRIFISNDHHDLSISLGADLMFSKLNEVESRYEEVNMALQRPDIASNQTQYRALMKELGNLEKIVSVYR
ncbi:MAG: hypothetical protein ACXWQX_08335, partial [Bdellovibrio sp.]